MGSESSIEEVLLRKGAQGIPGVLLNIDIFTLSSAAPELLEPPL